MKTDSLLKNEDDGRPEDSNPKVVQKKNETTKAKKICPFFKENRCNRGERCRFTHPRSILDDFSQEPQSKVQSLGKNKGSNNKQNRKGLTIEEAEKIGFDKLRETEISVIQKTFPRDSITVVEDRENFVVNVIFIPSDPDWPYDLNSFELLVTVPQNYPRRDMLEVSLLNEQAMPETIRRFIDTTISEWLEESKKQMESGNRIELMFLPFLEWLDRSLCDITTDAFKQFKRELDAKESDDRVKSSAPQSSQEGNTKCSEPNQQIRRAPTQRPNPSFLTFEDAEKVGFDKLRESEITVIQKRFPKDKIKVVEDGDNFTVDVMFTPSDPDWPYNINTFELLVTVPKDYPLEMLRVSLPKEQAMPETIRRYIDITISEWLEGKKKQRSSNQIELMFRPFLKWLDRSIDDITTEALKQFKRELVAKAAGIEILSPLMLQEKLKAASDSDGSEDDCDTQSEDSEEESEEESSSEDEENTQGVTLDIDPDKKGTEIELRQLQLKENASTLLFDKIKLVLQCSRCKTHADLFVHQNRVVSLRCGKCSHNQFVNFRPAMIHTFSSTMGYLDLDGCSAFDLILQDCRCQVACMACSKSSKIEGLSPGQMVSGWCQACNGRFKVATECVKFTQLVPSEILTAANQVIEVAPSKSRKPPKDPAMREGMPLPEFGTCRHYKHSYRWLRFPCCGKVYPCDVCHDKKEDHEMTFANRMICGHCCKEQNYSPDRPCTSCGQHMTKIRSSHWEGGQGCRDKIAMSKGDSAKHRNQSKTTSNHKKKVLNGGKPIKKNTKLRHS